MRHAPSRPFLLAAAFALAACDGTTAPLVLDEEGLRGDVTAAASAVSNPATVSLSALGPEISAAIGGVGAVAEVPVALLGDPTGFVAREALRARLLDRDRSVLTDLPQLVLGKTFVWDTTADRYVLSELAGAPANGVRFLLYAIDPVTHEIVVPLAQTGYVDITRTVTNQSLVARVEAYAGQVKVLDYAAAVSGTIVAPRFVVSGFVRNATDSLAFELTSALSLAAHTIEIDWRAAVPTRGLSSRVQQTITGGEAPQVMLDGRLQSANGKVRIFGTILQATGGTLTVDVNDDLFATIAVESFDDEDPTILNAQGEPLTEQQREMLEEIMDWFEEAFDFYEDLLDPVERLLGFGED